MRSRTIIISFLLAVATPGFLQAGIVTYSSLASWQAAVAGHAQFSEDFSEFTQDTYFQTVSVTAGPFTLAQIGHDPIFGDFRNYIDVPPLDFTDNSGVTNAAMYTKFGINTVDLTFSSPVFAWGANFYGAESGELDNLVLTAVGGGSAGTVPVTVDTGFFGFVTSPAVGISKITFQSRINNPDPTVGQGFGLENVVGAAVTAAPEPNSSVVLGLGLAIMTILYQRRGSRRSL